MLLAVMLGSLVMAAGIPQALGKHEGQDRGVWAFGHLLYLRIIRGTWPVLHPVAIALLVALAVIGSHLTGLAVGLITLAVIAALLVGEGVTTRRQSVA